MPMPVSAAVADPAGSSLLMVMLPPLTLPVDKGANFSGRTQVAAPARLPLSAPPDNGHSLAGVAAISIENGPLKDAPENVKACAELFEMASCNVLVAPTATLPNATVSGLS